MGSEENMDGRMPMPSDGVDTFYGSNWDPIISLNQSGNFGNPSIIPQNGFSNPRYTVVVENQILARSSHLAHFPSDSDLVDMVPKIPSFGSLSQQMVNTFGHISNIGLNSNTAPNNSIRIQKASRNGVESLENCQNSDGVLGTSPNGKWKRKISSGASSFKDAEHQQKDSCEETSEFPQDDDEKIQKIDQNFSAKSHRKQGVNQVKDNGVGSEPCKENYIHVRAKRGQATNSHSLAERVRRERISERMKLLQELVPGCNKITGKAVMLDEIINYVQSLQQQVEFLSMKLATVNPELNVDIEQILSKNCSKILNSRGSNATTLGFGTGLNPSHTFPGFSNGNFYATPSTTLPLHPLQCNSWNNELQSTQQMGFQCNPSGPDGLSNMEP